MFEVVGTEGGITMEPAALVVGRGVKERDGYAERFEYRRGRSEGALVRAFLNAIIQGEPVPVTAEEGRYAVELCWAALQSAREGRVVNLPMDPANYPSFSKAESGE
jgi:predicted dehydrogenase